MKINKVLKSKLHTIDVNNVSFGSTFTDHMLICRYKNGKWEEPEIMPFGTDIGLSPATMAVNYGQACFEGMKAFKNENDEVFLFRPDKNFERINISAKRLAMPEIPKDVFMDGLQTFVDLEREWIPSELGKSLYLRPVLFASEEMLLARISEEYIFAILATVANNYYSNPLKVKIADHYTRAANGGVGYTKAAGNYAASFYPTSLARDQGYDQIIWTDSITHTYFEESGTMNVMVRINDTLITPPVSDTILNGVTRNSIIELARKNGIEVKEEKINKNDVYKAHKDGSLKEMFGVGTAVIVNRFSEVGYENESLQLPAIDEKDSFAAKLKQELLLIQSGRSEDPFGWRVKVEEKNTVLN